MNDQSRRASSASLEIRQLRYLAALDRRIAALLLPLALQLRDRTDLQDRKKRLPELAPAWPEFDPLLVRVGNFVPMERICLNACGMPKP